MEHRDVIDERAITNDCASTATSEASQLCVSELAPLNYVDVKINRLQRIISALDDGGTEIAVLRSGILDLCGVDYVSVGSTRLRGIVGSPVDANLVKLQVQQDTDEGCCLSVICAVCKDANEDLILPSSVVDQLFTLQYQNMSRDDVQCDRDVDYVVNNMADVDGSQVVLSSDVVTDIDVNDVDHVDL